VARALGLGDRADLRRELLVERRSVRRDGEGCPLFGRERSNLALDRGGLVGEPDEPRDSLVTAMGRATRDSKSPGDCETSGS
jgi:hypothetical protein